MRLCRFRQSLFFNHYPFIINYSLFKYSCLMAARNKYMHKDKLMYSVRNTHFYRVF